MTAPFAPTHTVPESGLDSWAQPDPATPPGSPLPGRLPVQEVEQRGAWTKVLCSNGWETWVDGRRLEPIAIPAPVAPPAPPPPPVVTSQPPAVGTLDRSPLKVAGFPVNMASVGAVAIAISCFLPWVSINGQGQTAFKIPAAFLVDYKTNPSGLKLGWLLIVLAGAVVALTVRPVNPKARKLLGWAIAVVASVYVAQMQRLIGQTSTLSIFGSLGLGVYFAAVGGVLIGLGGGDS